MEGVYPIDNSFGGFLWRTLGGHLLRGSRVFVKNISIVSRISSNLKNTSEKLMLVGFKMVKLPKAWLRFFTDVYLSLVLGCKGFEFRETAEGFVLYCPAGRARYASWRNLGARPRM
jgi:hypothetical protein